jgi:hypothetical protein
MTRNDFEKLYYEIGDACDGLRYNMANRWSIVMHPDTFKGLRRQRAKNQTTLYGLDVVEDTRYELGEFAFRLKSVD